MSHRRSLAEYINSLTGQRLNTYRQNSVIQIQMAINASDTTWGWYGQNHGVSVFFADKYHFIHENHELRFNADNIPHFQIRVSHTRQLGGPYSDCIPPSREASHC